MAAGTEVRLARRGGRRKSKGLSGHRCACGADSVSPTAESDAAYYRASCRVEKDERLAFDTKGR